MTLKTSLILAGDASGAKAALDEANAGMERAAAEARDLGNAFAAADVATTKLAKAQSQAKAAVDQTKAAFAAGEIEVEEYNRQLLETKSALALVSSAHSAAITNLKQSQAAYDAAAGGMQQATRTTGEARVGYMMLGQQAQDVAIMLQGGANIGTVIATQGGQVATAVSMMGGRMAGFASFMAGPYGAAITIAIAVMANFVTTLDDASAAAAAAEEGADSLAKAQSALAGIFSGASGRIREQNELLLLNARLMAINLRSEALAKRASSEATLGAAGSRSLSSYAIGLYSGGARDAGKAAEAGFLASMVRSGGMSRDEALRRAEELDYSALKVSKQELQQAIIDSAVADLSGKTADLIDKSLNDGKLAGGLAKPERKKASGKKRGDGGTAARSEFAEDTAAKIAGIRDDFSDIPAAVERSNKALRQLDDIASDIERRKLVNKDALLADMADARRAIEESLNKPFNDFMAAQRESAEIDKLLLAGRYGEAEALKIVLRLQERQGPLSEAQLKTVLATVEGERRRSMALRDQRALIQANLDAVYDMRGALEQTVAGMLRGKFSVQSILSSIGNSYVQITSKRIVETMFGDTLRQLEDQATGQDKVREASDALAGTLGDGGKAVADFAAIVRKASTDIAGAPAAAAAPGAGEGDGLGNGDIVVTGAKAKAPPQAGRGADLLVDMTDQMLRRLGIALPLQLTDAVKQALGKLETSLPEMMKGAMIGSAASSLVLGKSGSNTGAMLGGAFGESAFKNVAPKLFKSLGDFAGPLGSIAGGLLGGLVGGLFKKTKSGGASIGLDARGNAGVTGTAGNSDELKKQASGWGGTLVNQLDRIAEALGADLGAFNVAIGKRDSGWIKVSASGNAAATTGKKVTSDIIYNGKDEGEALMAALGNAIADGAISGVSAAVQKALRSSSDVEKALKEALKVQDVEIAIGGIGAELAKQFKDFERQAAERVRIAREYGFDLTKLEERNAQDRLKLTQSLMAEQVGSLQDLIEQMTGGSLFEGSAVDQRQVILDKIAAAKAAADAGDEGAPDKLAALLEQLNAVSREAYGTTGNFASDRQTILDTARDTIARANQRIADAQRASDPALAATNAALNENNDQNASIIALLEGIQNGMAARSYATGQIDYSQLANLARTSIY